MNKQGGARKGAGRPPIDKSEKIVQEFYFIPLKYIEKVGRPAAKLIARDAVIKQAKKVTQKKQV